MEKSVYVLTIIAGADVFDSARMWVFLFVWLYDILVSFGLSENTSGYVRIEVGVKFGFDQSDGDDSGHGFVHIFYAAEILFGSPVIKFVFSV